MVKAEQNIKEKILEAAMEQFLAHGKNGTTTKTISDRAGVNKAMIHYYFSSKEQLFMECVRYIIDKMQNTFHTIDVKEITCYRTYIEKLVESYTLFIKAHNKNIIFLLWEHLNDENLLSEIKDIMGSHHLVDFITRTEEAMEKGYIKRTEPIRIYLNLISLILSTYMILPITLSFLGEDAEKNIEIIMHKREKEISRLLWEDIKGDINEKF